MHWMIFFTMQGDCRVQRGGSIFATGTTSDVIESCLREIDANDQRIKELENLLDKERQKAPAA